MSSSAVPSPTGSESLREPDDTRGIGGHPRGLAILFLTEMWERFSYYGMRALLFYFMVAPIALGGLGYDNVRAGIVYGNYTMGVYMMSIPGGFIADNFLGARSSVLFGGIVIALGHFTLALPSENAFYAGLILIVFGTGLLKPNVSSMVGSLYQPGDARRDAGFSIFYLGINLGAIAGPFAAGWLAQSDAFKAILRGWGFDPAHSWHWGFAAAGVGMTFGLIIYLLTGRRIAHVGRPPATTKSARPWGKLALVLLGAVVLFALVRLSDTNKNYEWIRFGYVVVPVTAIFWFGFQSNLESKRIAAVLMFSLAALIFWAIFEQAGSTIALFGEQNTDRTVPPSLHFDLNIFGRHLGWHDNEFPSAWFQSLNPLWVILLAPVFAWLWMRMGERQPSAPIKFTLGLVFLGLSFLLMVPAAQLIDAGRVSPLWLVGLFFLQTVGELLLSPVGLSTMTKLAPPKLVGLVMGIWFLAAALGNKLAGVLAGNFTSTDGHVLAAFFLKQTLWVGVAALILLACGPWLKKLMSGMK